MILSSLVSLLAHISFGRRHSRQELAALPLRSPLGLSGSVLGFLAVATALVETWLHPLVNFWSGLALLAALTLTYQVLRNTRPKRSPRTEKTSPIPPKAFYFHKLAVVS